MKKDWIPDHCCMTYEIRNAIDYYTTPELPRWDTENANWKLFKEKLFKNISVSRKGDAIVRMQCANAKAMRMRMGFGKNKRIFFAYPNRVCKKKACANSHTFAQSHTVMELCMIVD